MKSDLNSVDLAEFEKKKKRWFQFWKKYQTHYKASYTIRFELKPAAIETKLRFNGREFNVPNSFEVRWEAGAYVAAPKPIFETHDPDRFGLS
jgi:hypothetical protein